MSNRPTFSWTPVDEEIDRVTLVADPVSRVIPDGCRVSVSVYTDERSEYRDSGRVMVPYRVASVQLIDSEGKRATDGGKVRFGGTLASGASYARCEERLGYLGFNDADDPSKRPALYWWTTQVTGWRADGFAEDLPEGAMTHLRDVFADAARFVGEHFPYLWEGAAEALARRDLAAAEASMVKARADIKAARSALKKAERAHERAEAKHAAKAVR